MSSAQAEATGPAEAAAPSDGPASATAASGPRWLQALGLHRRELRAWALYDWANSAFATVIGAAVFPIFYANVAAADLPANEATARYAFTASVALALVALLMPVLGAVADYLGAKKRLLGTFLALGALATATMFFIGRGEWLFASVVFVLGNIGFAGANVFYNSLLPHIAREGEVDRVSSAGYALGYLGGGLLLTINLTWILFPDAFGLADAEMATRLSFVSVAVWWLGFSLPLFRRVPEPPRRLEAGEVPGLNPVRVGVTRLVETFREIPGYRHAFLFLLAFLGLQRWDRHDQRDGSSLWHRDRSGAIPSHWRYSGGAVCRDALHLSLWPPGRADRRQAGHLSRPGGVRRGQRAGLLHDDGPALLRAGYPRRRRDRRQSGPQPLALCQPDPATQVRGVLCLPCRG